MVKDQSRYITLRVPHLQEFPKVGIGEHIKSVKNDLLEVKDDHPILRSREEHPANPKARKEIIIYIYHDDIILILGISLKQMAGRLTLRISSMCVWKCCSQSIIGKKSNNNSYDRSVGERHWIKSLCIKH